MSSATFRPTKSLGSIHPPSERKNAPIRCSIGNDRRLYDAVSSVNEKVDGKNWSLGNGREVMIML